jgi:hypothetical protein
LFDPTAKAPNLPIKLLPNYSTTPQLNSIFLASMTTIAYLKPAILNFFGKATKHIALILGLPTKLAWQKAINISNIVVMWC